MVEAGAGPWAPEASQATTEGGGAGWGCSTASTGGTQQDKADSRMLADARPLPTSRWRERPRALSPQLRLAACQHGRGRS